MAKILKKFKFQIPVSKTSSHNGRLSQVNIGNIEVDAVATLFYTENPVIDYNSILWNGVDILPLISNFDAADEMMQTIYNASRNQLIYTLEEEGVLND